MTQELALRESTALTVHDLKGRHDRIQDVLKKIMKQGVDYGTIPGCGDKRALLKPGAEKILSTFELAVKIEPEHITDLSEPGKVRYRIISPIVHIHSGLVVGHGVGECSSEEEKYAWKAAVCNEEWEECDPSDRRSKWKRGKSGSKNYQVKQIRTNPADVANTVLKMCKKRSVVDGTLTATGASDMFEQGEDVTGDEDEGFNREGMKEEKQEKPQPSSGPRMPGYAGKHANQPVADQTLETLHEFYPGLIKSIEDPKKADWKARNQVVADAMKKRMDALESPPSDLLTALDITSRMGACQSMSELVNLMNLAVANQASYSVEDFEAISITFKQTRPKFAEKKSK